MANDSKPPPRAIVRLETLEGLLAQPLENEAGILDLLVSQAGKGQGHPELWEKLHEAAQRSERLAELAFAYERVAQDRRLKSLPGPMQAEIWMHLGVFFADIFGDADGAQTYFERVLALSPAHAEAFSRLERLFEGRGEGLALSDLYASAATNRSDKAEQLRLLKRAVELRAGQAGEEDKLVKLCQQVLKVDPSDTDTRRVLEARYAKAGRFGDLAKLLELALAAEPAPSADEAFEMHAYLMALYSRELRELERATPHAEEVLRKEPAHILARKVAEDLLKHKSMAARAAFALEAAYIDSGALGDAGKMLAIQIEQVRGPKRLEAQKRLAVLRQDRLGDAPGALALYEQIVAVDPADEDVRARFLALAAQLDKRLEASRVLQRALTGAKDAALRARIGVETGELSLELGDPKRARSALQTVVEAGGDDAAVLRAARALEPIAVEARDHKLLALLLDKLGSVEPAEERRADALARLAQLAEGELKDPDRAIAAYRKLLATPREDEALRALERLYEATSAHEELAATLDRLAAREADREASRGLAFRAADVRSTKLPSRAAALDAWRALLEVHGAARDVFARMMPLLEQERGWEELAATIEADAALAPAAERAPSLARLAGVRQTRLGDGAGALDAYARALALDPAERASRLAVEKLLAAGDLRLRAAELLEPIYRTESAAAGLIKVLEARAALSEEVGPRLSALREAAQLAERELKDPRRALELVGRGIEEAAAGALGDLPVWLGHLDDLSPASGDARRRADVLVKALGARDVTCPALAELARRAAQSLEACGEVAEALAIFRRALAFEPSSVELLTRVDALLREQGSPEERLSLYRAALDQPCSPARRREILHAIGGIQRRDLADLSAAIATYRTALAEDPTDALAYEALLDAHAAAGAWDELEAELQRGLSRTSGDGRVALLLRMGRLTVSRGAAAQALAPYREVLATKPEAAEVLDEIESLADVVGDAALLRDVLERRIELAENPEGEAALHERLGALLADKLGDAGAALAARRTSAKLADGTGDVARAVRLHELVLASNPDDREAAARLVELYKATGAWDRLPAAYAVLLRAAEGEGEATELVLALEAPAVQAHAVDAFLAAAFEVLARRPSPERASALLAAKARVLASDPDRQDGAAAAYRAVIDAVGDEWGPAADAFDAFLAARPERRADRRWLLAFRAERASEPDRVRALLAWAAYEEGPMAAPAAAAEVYARVLAADPDCDDALAARARLLYQLGDCEGAAVALGARRDRSEGAARLALDLELAALLLDRLDRPDEALTAVAGVLEAAPTDAAGIRIAHGALAHPASRVRAAELLERASEAVEDPHARAEILEVLLSAPHDAPELAASRRGWFEGLLDIHEGAKERAFDVALRAVRELPHEPALWERAESLARELARPGPIAAAYRAAIAEPTPALREEDAMEEIGRRAVDYQEEWFEEQDAVVALLRQVLALAPGASWAFDRLKLVYNAAERWSELLALYDMALARALDAGLRAEILEDAAQIAKDFAAAPERAIRYLEELQRIKKNDGRVRASLERLYERYGHHRPLIELLEAQLGALDGESAQKLRLRISVLWLDGARDPKSAFASIEEVLSAEPERAEAFELLERIVQLEPPSRKAPDEEPTSKRAPSVRARAAALLEARYRSRGRTEDLVRMLEIELEGVTTKKERVKRLRELAKLRIETIGDEVGALEDIAALVAIEPGGEEPRRELARLAESTGRHARHAEVLIDVAARSKGDARRAELLGAAAAILESRLSDPARAIELWHQVLALAGDDHAQQLLPARKLDALLAATGGDAARCDVLERLGGIEPEPAGRRHALGEAARLAAEVLGDRPRAIRAFRRRLDEDANDREALDGLVRELEATDALRELTAALGRRAALGGREEARRDRVAIARILGDRLGEPAEAIAAWSSLRSELGPDEESCDALAGLYQRTGRDAELVALYESEAASATAAPRRAAMWRRAGDFHRERGALDLATLSYEAALEADVHDEAAQRGLEAVLVAVRDRGRDELSAVVGALGRVYAELGDDVRTISLLEPRLAIASTDAERVEILSHTSELLEARGEAAAAFDVSWRAFALAPSDELTAEVVIRTASAAARWDVVASSLGPILEARKEVPADIARMLFWHVGLFFRDERHDPDAAEQALERALAYGENDVLILRALADLRRRSRDRGLVTTLLRLADATGGDLDLYREAAETAADHVRDRALALSIGEKLFELAVVRWASGAHDAEVESEQERALFSSGAWTSSELGETSSLGQDAPGAATWALDFLVRTAREDAERDRVVDLLLRGAELPFGDMKRRAIKLSAADVAEPERALSIYRELFKLDPRDELVGGRLEGAYRGAGRLRELAELRSAQVDAAETTERRVELRFDAALLLADIGDTDAAIAALTTNLEEIPAHGPSVARLAALYQAKGLSAELAALWEEQAQKRDAAGDRDVAAGLWLQAAELAEALGDGARAIRGYRRAASTDSPAALDRLARLHTTRAEHASAAEVLERLLGRSDARDAPAVALRLADALTITGDGERARARLEAAHAAAPEDGAVAARLGELYRRIEAWEPLAALVARSAEDAPDRATRLARLREAAELHLRRRNDPSAAIPLLEQAAALAPEDLGIRLSTCDAMSAAGRFDEAAAALRSMIEGYGARRPKERALVHHQLARLSLAQGDRARALGELDAASKIDPAHPAILQALARLALEEGQLDRAERSFRALLLVVRRAAREGAVSGGVGRAEVLLELAAIAERQGEQDRAAELVESAFEEARDSEGEMDELVRALRATGKHAALARALEIRLGAHGEGPAAAAILHELATVYEEHLGKSEAALDARLRALSLSPDAQALHDAAIGLTRRTGGLDKYLTTVSQLVERSAEPPRAAKLLLLLGRALEEEQHDDAEAARAYERAERLLTEDDGGDGPSPLLSDAWRALERLHRRAGDHAAEARVLEQRVAAAEKRGEEPASRAESLYRLAELWLATPGARDAGASLLEQAILLDSDAERAESMLRAALASGADDRLVELFGSFARRTERGRALVDALVLLAERAGELDPLGRLEEAASVATRLGDRPLAESLLRRVLAEAGKRGDGTTEGAGLATALTALAELRREEGDLAEAADLKQRAAELVEPAEERLLLLEVARLAAGPLGDGERAARIYEGLRAREPADREIWAPLADVYRVLGDAKRLGGLLDETALLVDTLEERVALRLERAMISMRENPDVAMSLLREILEDDPAQLQAAMLLSGMLEARGETAELAALLAKQLDAAKDREDKASVISLSMRLGALLEQQDDEHAALDVYHGALDWDAGSRGALRAVVRLSLKRDDSLDLGDALGRLLDVEEGQEAVDLALQLAELRAANGDEAGAEQAITTGFKACPSSELLRDELVRRYSEREAWSELAGVYLLDAGVRTAVDDRVACLLRAADVLRSRAGDVAGAAEILRGALEVAPSDREVLHGLIEAYAALGEHERAAQAVSAAIETTPEDAWLFRARAELHRAMGRTDLSLADLELAQTKSAGGYSADLIAELESALVVGGVAGRSERDLRLELAEVLLKAGETDRARAELTDLVKKDGKDRAALRALSALEEGIERWDAASATLRRLLALEDGDALVQTALKLAVACERADRFADARAGLERALKIAPGNDEVRELLRRVYEATGANRELAQLILQDASRGADVSGRFAHLLHAGRLLSESAEDVPQAISVLEEARSLRPEEQEATLLLAEAYASAGRRAEASTLLEEAVAAHKGRRSKPLSVVYQRIAAIEEAAGRAPQALAALQKAFESDPHAGGLAMRLGLLAASLGDREVAGRVFRSLTLMKPAVAGGAEGATAAAKAVAYYHLGRIADEQGDRRKARMMVEKAVSEDPEFAPARALLDELRGA